MSDKLIVKISDFNTPNAFKDLSRCIEQHYLNHKLELIIAQKPSSSSTTTTKLSSSTTPYPSSKTLLSEISSVWNGSCFHVVKATLASILFDNSFLNNYIRSGIKFQKFQKFNYFIIFFITNTKRSFHCNVFNINGINSIFRNFTKSIITFKT